MAADIRVELSLHPAQLKIHQSAARFVAVVAGRRFGKSHLAATRAAMKAYDPKNVKKKAVWLVAPTQQQGKQIYWGMLMNMLAPLIDKINVNEGMIFLKNGVDIAVKGADRPDTLRGVGLYDVILDEYATMKPQVWEEIIRPALSDVEGTAMFIGTPAGRNHFYDLCVEAAGPGGKLPYRGDAAPHDEWQLFHYTSLDNPHLPQGEVERARKTLSSRAFRQEYLASFETTGGGQFEREWLKFVDGPPMMVDPHDPQKKRMIEVPGDWYVVADLGGFADIAKAVTYREKRLDRTAIWTVKVLDEEGEKDLPRWYAKELQLGRWGVRETAERIVAACFGVETTNLGIEKGALYNSVSPEISAVASVKGIALRAEPLSHENKNKEARIVWALQGRFQHGKILLQRGPWNKEFEDEYSNFPSTMVHDDSMDGLAFMPQLAKASVFRNFGEESVEPYWEPIDASVGF